MTIGTNRPLKRVAIVGAGVAGLCAHLALRASGVEVMHYERKRGFGHEGGCFILWPNGANILNRLGLDGRLPKIGFPTEHFTTYGVDGEHITSVSFDGFAELAGSPVYLVTRQDLHAELVAQVGLDNLNLDSACTAVDQDEDSVTLTLADGSTAEADLVVCADGIRSPLRRTLIDPTESEYVGITYWTGWFADEGFMRAHSPKPNGTIEYWGVGRRLAILPVGGDRVGFAFIARVPADHTLADRYAQLCEMYGGWPTMVEALLERLANETIIHWPVYDLAPLSRWSNGRAVAIGDAAHASAPTMGQGANMAMEDGYVLAECLDGGRTELGEALSTYSSQRRPRTEMIVRESRKRAQAATETDLDRLAEIVEQTRSDTQHAVWDGLEKIITGGPVLAPAH